MAPDAFWRLHPVAFWWMFEAKRPPVMYGRLTESEAESLYRMAYGDRSA